MTPLGLVLASLAVYRVAAMVAHEDGPWRVFARLRQHAMGKAVDGRWPAWVADGLMCPRCLSVWAALVLVPAAAHGGPVVVGAVAVLAVSGAACIIESRS